jgi:uncharacterized membrane protein
MVSEAARLAPTDEDLSEPRAAFDPEPVLLALAGLLFLLVPSLLRHWSFLSSAYDLGIFDQAVFLISTGQPPVSSFLGFHILGDHASFVLYPLAACYLIWSSATTLLTIQAAALALGVLPTWILARKAGHSRAETRLLAGAYLLSPIAFNASLFDFHPEALAVPLLLLAALAARSRRPLLFAVCTATTLACKAVLGLTVAAMGAWLLFRERRRRYGVAALIGGLTWVVITSTWVIPRFSGAPPAALARYSYLGTSPGGVLLSPLTHPRLLASRLVSAQTLAYVAKCVLPLGWAVGGGSISPLIGTIPTFLLNVLADDPHQRSLRYQYGLPLLPFLVLSIIGVRAPRRGWVRRRALVIWWIVTAFLFQTNLPDLAERLRRAGSSLADVRAAVQMVDGYGPVLTTAELAPHLTHRTVVEMTDLSRPTPRLDRFDFVLLSLREPGWRSSVAMTLRLLRDLKSEPSFQCVFRQDGVFLFKRTR